MRASPPAGYSFGETTFVRASTTAAGNLPESSFFSLFSVPNPERPPTPIEAKLPFPLSLLQRIPGLPPVLTAVEVNEGPLRFKTGVDDSSGRLLAINRVGEPAATVHIRWTPIPWRYHANPGRLPPRTILNPLVSQRFEMLDGHFGFDDSHGTGIHGFGAGRTFPNFPHGLSLDIGAVIDVLQGFGKLAGFQGVLVVNGIITPPRALDLNIMMRFLDPNGRLRATAALPPLAQRPLPDPGMSFLMLLGQPDPLRPSKLIRGSAGSIVGIELHEVLREISLDFAVLARAGPRSQVEAGASVGTSRSTWSLSLEGPPPFAVQSRESEFSLQRDAASDLGSEAVFGGLTAELVEGRCFPTSVGSHPGDLYRIGAFGPIGSGSVEFEGAKGMLSMVSFLAVEPLTFSNLYIFRFRDPGGRFRRNGGVA